MIGWYVHHQGAGHLQRATLVAEVLRARGEQVTLLGSHLPGVPEVAAVGLALDDGPSATDVDARGLLHWAPLRHDGLRERMAAVARWVQAERPSLVVVDVSVEVAVFVRLMGVPVVVVGQPGDRGDRAHRAGYDAASAVLAPWPEVAHPCPVLSDVGAPVHCVGGLAPRPVTGQRDGSAVVLLGRDDEDAGLLETVRTALPQLRWSAAGGGHWVDDLPVRLASADLVVAHAGQNTIAQVASYGVPTVVVPRSRPHDEQVHLARELGRLGLAAVTSDPAAANWPELYASARERAARWPLWGTDGAVERAADVLLEVAHG